MKKDNLGIYKGIDEIEKKISVFEWEKIFLLSKNTTVYNHPHFVLNWFRTFSKLRKNLPILIKCEIGDRTIILPMEIFKKSYYIYKYKDLYGIGGPISLDFQDPLISGENISPNEMRLLWEELFRIIRQKIPECDQVIIPRLRASIAAGSDNCEPSNVSPYVDLNDFENLDDVLSKCKASHRGDVKRQIRRLKEIGDITMHTFSPSENEDAQEELGRFYKAYKCQWGPQGVHTYETNEAQKFFRFLINDMLKTGLIHFSVLKCAGDPIHWHFGFLHNKRLYYYKPTYDLSWSKYSPGKVHVAYLIKECIEKSVRYFDFLYGDEPYKYNWVPTDEKLYCLKKWNGLRPIRRLIEEFIKPTYHYVKKIDLKKKAEKQ